MRWVQDPIFVISPCLLSPFFGGERIKVRGKTEDAKISTLTLSLSLTKGRGKKTTIPVLHPNAFLTLTGIYFKYILLLIGGETKNVKDPFFKTERRRV